MNIRHEPLSPAAYAILGLLMLRPRHGYDLAACFDPDSDTGLGLVCQLRMNLLYSHLKRLEELGYIIGNVEISGARPPRRVYSLTPSGEAEFRTWLDMPVQRIRQVRMDFLLKLFFSRQISGHDTSALLEGQIAACQRYVGDLEAQDEGVVKDSFRHLVYQARVRAALSTTAWLKECAAEWVMAR